MVALRQWRDRARWLEVAVAGGVSAVLVAPWLGPFLADWLAAGRPQALAADLLESDASYVRLFSRLATRCGSCWPSPAPSA